MEVLTIHNRFDISQYCDTSNQLVVFAIWMVKLAWFVFSDQLADLYMEIAL